MAVSPPGDIVLEVARAADPTAVRSARTRLENAAGAAATVSFEAAATADANLRAALQTSAADAAPDAYRKFEAMVLQSFIKPMMPENAESVYGGGMAGQMWKSLLAEEVGKEMAANGGIGIADHLLRDHYTMENDRKVPLRGVSDGPEKAEADKQALLSDALVNQIERRTAQAIGIGGGVTGTDPEQES